MSQEKWEKAKKEAKTILQERAKLRGMITYSELVKQIHTIKFDAHDTRLFKLLEEISIDENLEKRGMLSVIVVHKTGDMQPGKGFFELAQILGRNTSDILECWVNELHKVHATWSN